MTHRTLTPKQSLQGFTLIETLVAIAILTVAIVGPFVAIQNALTASFAARDQLVASMLAQEAIEYVRAIRDGNYIYNVANPSGARSWFYGIDATNGVNCVDRNCTIDFKENTHAWCGANGSGTCPVLNRSTSNYLYSHLPANSTNVASVFRRTVRLTSLNAREMQVTVTMNWSTANRAYTITITETLSAWL